MAQDIPTRPAASDRVECRAALDPCVRMFIIALMLLGYGLYCAYDLFVAQKYDPSEQMAIYVYNLACVLLVPIGAVCLVWGVVMLRRRLAADQEGIGFLGHEKVAWGQIHRIVMRGKGRLDLYYKDKDGEEDVLGLDSWKLKNFAELVALVEAKTPQAPVEAARTRR
jgi:hypothetical protein